MLTITRCFIAFPLLAIGSLLIAVAESPASPILYSWSSQGGNTGSFVYDNILSPNPVSEFTWDQANITHSGPAVQYSVSRDFFGTQIVMSGNQIGSAFFSILMQHTMQSLPSVPASFAFNDSNDAGPGWLGGSFLTMNNSFPMNNIINQGPASVPVNDPPMITSATINGIDGNVSVNESGSTFPFTLSALATDPQAGVLKFNIDGVGPTNAVATGANSIRLSHSVNRSVPGADSNGGPAGSYEFEVIDANGLNHVVTRTVSVLNVAPTVISATINGVDDDLVLSEGNPFQLELQMQSTDPGPDTQSFFINGIPGGVGSDVPGSPRVSNVVIQAFSGQSGVFPIAFEVMDDDTISSVSRTVTVENLPPTIDSITTDVLTQLLSPVDFSATASDPGNDPLLFEWDFDIDGVFDDFSGPSGSFVAPNVGTFPIRLRVSDGDGGEAFASFVITAIPEPASALLLIFGIVGALPSRVGTHI